MNIKDYSFLIHRGIPLLFKSLEYGQIVKMLGSGHMEVQCFDGEKRIAHIRGKMRKKVRKPKNLKNIEM